MSDCAESKDDAVADDDEDNADDNLIKLGEACGVISYWQLPTNLNRCPVNPCRTVFEDNSALKEHYSLEHSKYAILCPPCGEPVMTKSKGIHVFENHFRKYHPNLQQPYDFRTTRKPKSSNKQV